MRWSPSKNSPRGSEDLYCLQSLPAPWKAQPLRSLSPVPMVEDHRCAISRRFRDRGKSTSSSSGVNRRGRPVEGEGGGEWEIDEVVRCAGGRFGERDDGVRWGKSDGFIKRTHLDRLIPEFCIHIAVITHVIDNVVSTRCINEVHQRGVSMRCINEVFQPVWIR